MDKKKIYGLIEILIVVGYAACAGLWIKRGVVETVRWGEISAGSFFCAAPWIALSVLNLHRYWTKHRKKS